MRRAHVASIVCGAMLAVACDSSSNRYPGFSVGPDASNGFPGTGSGSSSGGGSGGGSAPRDAASVERGDGSATGADGGGDTTACGMCIGNNVCCSDPSSIDYGRCYTPMCTGCCQSGRDAGSCATGASCGSNETCCTKAGSLEYGQCFVNTCTGCCQGGSPVPDGGGDAGICGPCFAGMICCSTPGAMQYGRCYPPSCPGCCQ